MDRKHDTTRHCNARRKAAPLSAYVMCPPITESDDKFSALRHLVEAAGAHTDNYTVGFVLEPDNSGDTH